MTPQEQLALGQITPAQYLQMHLTQNATEGGAASPQAPNPLAGALASAGLQLPPQGAAQPPPMPSQAAPAFSPMAAPVPHPMTPMPTPEQGNTSPAAAKYFSPLHQARAAVSEQGLDVNANALTGMPKRLAIASAPGTDGGGAPGAANMQPSDLDPVAPLLRPTGGTGGAHRVGMSPADQQYSRDLAASEDAARRTNETAAGSIQGIASAFGQQSNALAAESQHGLESYQQQQQENAAHQRELQQQAKDAQAKIAAKISDLDAQGVDPNRYFQEQSTGQKIMGALAIGLGAFGAHALGPNGHDSTNTALEIMNNAITRDVEAQKANLQKNLSVMGQRMNLNAEGFSQQRAMLEAERESIQSGYAVALNQTAKKAAMFKDNSEVQTQSAKITAGLQDAANQRVDSVNQQLYGIRKGAERVVGGGGGEDPRKWIRERTTKLIDEGKVPDAEAAHREAVKEWSALDVGGTSPLPSMLAQPKGGAGADKAKESADAEAHMQSLADQVKSVAYNPARVLQGTDAFAAKNTQDRWNSGVMGAMHRKYGVRSPEAMEKVGHAYLIEPGDTESTVRRKTSAAIADLGGAPAAQPDANPAGLEAEDDK